MLAYLDATMSLVEMEVSEVTGTKISSGPEKGKQTNELDHTCYNNQQVPNAFYRWLAFGLAAWAHLVP